MTFRDNFVVDLSAEKSYVLFVGGNNPRRQQRNEKMLNAHEIAAARIAAVLTAPLGTRWWLWSDGTLTSTDSASRYETDRDPEGPQAVQVDTSTGSANQDSTHYSSGIETSDVQRMVGDALAVIVDVDGALAELLRGRDGLYRLPRGGRTGAFALAVKEWAAIDTDAIDTGAP